MRELLKRAGFRIRSPKRADCAHCKGSSHSSVAYTDAVAYCHRCGWRSSRERLARELDPPAKHKARPHKWMLRSASGPAVQRTLEAQAMAAAFETWLNETLSAIGLRERKVYWNKRRLGAYLADQAEDLAVWDELIALTEEEEWLDVLWDFLTASRNSRWWDPPATQEEIFECWRHTQARCVSAKIETSRRDAAAESLLTPAEMKAVRRGQLLGLHPCIALAQGFSDDAPVRAARWFLVTGEKAKSWGAPATERAAAVPPVKA